MHENDAVRFIVLYALPFVAHNITNRHFPTISRGDLLEAIDNVIEFYILNDSVYQNYIAPKRINKKTLLESRDSDDFIEIILKNIGFLQKSDYNNYELKFVHQYFHDYFSAKYILNIIEALDLGFGNKHIEEVKFWFHKFGLDSIWYTNLNEVEIYRLIGEISSDYVFYTYLSCKILDYAEFLPDNKTAIVLSDDSLVKFDVKTGNVIECIIDSDKVYNYNRKTPEREDLDESLLMEIVTQLDIFRNCDFRGAEFKFFESEYKEYLRKMGAIVD